MTFAELRKKEGRISGLVALERVLPRKKRAKIKEYLLFTAPIFVMVLFFFEESHFIPFDVLFGAMFLIIAAWLVVFMVDCFYYAHYFKAAHVSVPEWGLGSNGKHGSASQVPYEILEIVSHTHSADLTRGFLESNAGKLMFERLDIAHEKSHAFILGARQKIYADSISFPDPVQLVSYTKKVLEVDHDLVTFLAALQITEADFLAVANWVSVIYERKKEMHRWWGKDSLGRIRGIGKDWTRGRADLLEKFGSFVLPEADELLFKNEIDELEKMLARSAAADVMIVTETKEELVAVVSGLAGRIRDGSVLPQIEHKKILMLNSWTLEHAADTDSQFENVLIKLFNQATEIGDIILVISDIHSLTLSAKKHHIDVAQFLEPYLTSDRIHIVVGATKSYVSEVSASQAGVELINWFQRVVVDREKNAVRIRTLQHKIFDIERMTRMFFTQQSLRAIADLEEKKQATLESIIPQLLKKKVSRVTERVIHTL